MAYDIYWRYNSDDDYDRTSDATGVEAASPEAATAKFAEARFEKPHSAIVIDHGTDTAYIVERVEAPSYRRVTS